jgi:hypothetical protein
MCHVVSNSTKIQTTPAMPNSGVSTLVSTSGVMHNQVVRPSTNVRNVYTCMGYTWLGKQKNVRKKSVALLKILL